MNSQRPAWWLYGSLGAIVAMVLLARLGVGLVMASFTPGPPDRPVPILRDEMRELTRRPAEPDVNPAGVAALRPPPEPVRAPWPVRTVWKSPLPAPMAGEAPPLRVDLGALPHESAMLAIMRAPAPDDAKADALLTLMSELPEEMQAGAAEQAMKWLRDRNYRAFAWPILLNPRTNGAVLATMFADLMERPDAVTLPTLVKIAETPAHPFAESAHDNLALIFGKDFGIDWAEWNGVVLEKLSTPPAESSDPPVLAGP